VLSALDEDPRWLLVWGVGGLGECCCAGGSVHRDTERGIGIGWAGTCSSVGKHPWVVRRGGQVQGFARGAADAAPRAEVVQQYGEPGGGRRWAYTLRDLILIDIDSEDALRSFHRLAGTVPRDKVLGTAKTPRGWHVLLRAPGGWEQRGLNAAMRSWLRDWDGTDPRKVGRRGFLLDVRTGAGRYAVWPGGTGGRRWIVGPEFSAALGFAGRGMPASRMVTDGTGAPWNLAEVPQLPEVSVAPAAVGTAGGGADGKAAAWLDLTRWCRQMEQMEPETGRNNFLNKTAYLTGRAAIAAGWPEEKVFRRLLAAAQRCGCPGAEATIRSGLEAAS
jgi:hypothetical protein